MVVSKRGLLKCIVIVIVLVGFQDASTISATELNIVENSTEDSEDDHTEDSYEDYDYSLEETIVACTCGIFLDGQLNRNGTIKEDEENPALLIETETLMLPCGPKGTKRCLRRCVDEVITHLSKSDAMICGSIDRDVFKESAFLFTQNCDDEWVNSWYTGGKEHCCKDGEVYRCPRSWRGSLKKSEFRFQRPR